MRDCVAPPFDANLTAALLALNNAHAEELSYKTPEDFPALIEAGLACAGGGGQAWR